MPRICVICGNHHYTVTQEVRSNASVTPSPGELAYYPHCSMQHDTYDVFTEPERRFDGGTAFDRSRRVPVCSDAECLATFETMQLLAKLGSVLQG